MRITQWGIYWRVDNKAIGYAIYLYANNKLKFKWRILPHHYASRYDCTRAWQRGYITGVLDKVVDIDHEVEAWALLEIID